jgi:uncharacterized membrane protein YphA (DoxX/SURF4 family)
MDKHLATLGRILFAVPMIVFGIQCIGHGKFTGGLPPVPPWAPGGAVGAYLVGIALVVAGLGMVVNKYARSSALFIGVFFLLSVLFLQLQHLQDALHNGNARTGALEPLALAAAAFALAALLPPDLLASFGSAANTRMILFGRIVFGISMVIFGWQHYIYRVFLSTLVQAWLPGHMFWILLTGASMALAGAAIATNIVGRLASVMLGIMFLLFVLTLHLPRVLAAIHNQDELTSLFVALAFSGASFILAAASTNR